MFKNTSKEEAKDNYMPSPNRDGHDNQETKSKLRLDETSSLRESAQTVQDDLKVMANQAGRQARSLANSAEISFTNRIRTNPVQSSFIALGVGFVVGALLLRR